jgi:WD40 repeat protein
MSGPLLPYTRAANSSSSSSWGSRYHCKVAFSAHGGSLGPAGGCGSSRARLVAAATPACLKGCLRTALAPQRWAPHCLVLENDPQCSHATTTSLGLVEATLICCRYRGHVSLKTIKDVAFVGPQQDMVAAGSDDGRVFIWDRDTGLFWWGRCTGEASQQCGCTGWMYLVVVGIGGVLMPSSTHSSSHACLSTPSLVSGQVLPQRTQLWVAVCWRCDLSFPYAPRLLVPPLPAPCHPQAPLSPPSEATAMSSTASTATPRPPCWPPVASMQQSSCGAPA